MLTLALLLLLLGFSSSADPLKVTELKPCNDGETLVAFGLCTPKVNELKRYLKIYGGRKPPLETFRNMSTACEKTTECLGVLQCKEAQESNALFQEACAQLFLLAADIHSCLPKFFKAVYNKEGCTKEHDYFTKDLTKKRAAYTAGKQCFLDFVKANCSAEADTFLKDDSKYANFLSTITIPPNLGTCEGFHYQLEGFQCKPVMEDLDVKGKSVNLDTFKLDAPEMLEAIRVCRAAEKCAKDSCSLGPTFRRIESGCDALEVANTEYVLCARKINNEKMDLNKYKCFEGGNFADKSPKASCRRLKEKKECVKEIMEDVCGKAAVTNYEKTVEKVAKALECDGIVF